MAKRNRRRKTLNVRPASIGYAVIFAIGIVPWCFYCLTRTSAGQIDDRANVLEGEKRVYQQMLSREQAAWNNAKELGRLEDAIKRTGLDLNFPTSQAVVRVSPAGQVKAHPTLIASVNKARAERIAAAKAGTVEAGVRTSQVKQRYSRRRR